MSEIHVLCFRGTCYHQRRSRGHARPIRSVAGSDPSLAIATIDSSAISTVLLALWSGSTWGGRGT